MVDILFRDNWGATAELGGGMRLPAVGVHCAVASCDRRPESRGWCGKHYQRWRKYGDPTTTRRDRASGPPAERFWAKVDTPSLLDCWTWTGTTRPDGYGVLRVDGCLLRAHCFAFELLVGPIPDGLELDHLCRNPSCVNPAHLEPVTHQVNLLRGTSPAALNAAATHCVNGHEFTAENTYRPPSRPATRQCRACTRDRARRRAA